MVPELPGHITQGYFSARPGPFSFCLCRAFLFSFPRRRLPISTSRTNFYQGSHLRLQHQIQDCFSCRKNEKNKNRKNKKLSAPLLAAGLLASGLVINFIVPSADHICGFIQLNDKQPWSCNISISEVWF